MKFCLATVHHLFYLASRTSSSSFPPVYHEMSRRTSNRLRDRTMSSKSMEAPKSPPPKKKTKHTKKPKPKAKVKEQPPLDGPWYRIFTKGDPEYDEYMATEWGVETRGDVALLERISLEGAQSGLSWLTILRKRQAYRRVFSNFDIAKVAAMTDSDIQRIVEEQDPENLRNLVVRHRGKIESVVNNAQRIQELFPGDEGKSLDEYLWSFVQDQPILNRWNGKLADGLTQTEESKAMSKALKKLGFRFVGPTTCYAMMQATGMVIDHPEHSPEWEAALQRLQKRPGGYQEGSRVGK